MRFLWDLFATLTITILIVGLTVKGYLPSWIAGIMLVVFVAFRALTRVIGGVRECIYYPFTIFFFLILIIFVVLKGGWQDVFAILIGTFYGGLEKIIAETIKLAGGGYVGIYLVVLLLFGLIFLRWVGLQMGSKFIYHSIFSIGAPIFIILTFLSTASHGNWREAVIIGCSLMALLVMLEGFYVMFYGFFRR
jgi:hypothetical protein